MTSRGPAARALIAAAIPALLPFLLRGGGAAWGREFKPSLHLLSIGVSVYEDGRVGKLDYAHFDALAVAEAFKEQEGKDRLFDKVHAQTLVNEQVTRESVYEALDDLGHAGPNDAVIIFMAGHAKLADEQYCYLTYNAKWDNPCALGLDSGDIERKIRMLRKNAGVKMVVLFLDTCHSGAAEVRGSRGKDGGADLGQAFKDAEGLFVLSSSKSNEPSGESRAFRLGAQPGHGLFTYAILRGLAELGGSPEVVSVSQLFDYVSKKVPEKNRKQHPYQRLEGTAMPIWRGPGPAAATLPGGQARTGDSASGRGSTAPAALPQGMVRLEATTFPMGSPEGEGDPDEHPRRQVRLDEFWLDESEVTVAQYRRFADEAKGSVPAQPKWSSDDHPVVNVSWADADAYCRRLGKRLPTEAEWEFAALGGSDGVLDAAAWHRANAAGMARPVRGKEPNRHGLYDMLGNAWEWVSDWYGQDYYRSAPEANPRGPASGKYRVIRGGSWNNDPSNCRPANRNSSDPAGSGLDNIGLRCAMTPR